MAVRDTKFIWDDQSAINDINNTDVVDNVDRPVFMTVFSSDKGPETLQKSITGKEFFALYGDIPNFNRHGQPLLQAARIANAGGLQYCKRVVAMDSKLANLSLIANVTETQVQDTNKSGKPIYVHSHINEEYWTITDDEEDKKNYTTYDDAKDYTAGDVVKSSHDIYYKALKDILATDEAGKIVEEETTDTSYLASNGSTKYTTPIRHKAAKIKYIFSSLDTLQNDPQNANKTDNIKTVFDRVINESYANKDDMSKKKITATTYWTQYKRTGYEGDALLKKLAYSEQWKATMEYYPGDICKIDATYFICNVKNTDKNPTISSQNKLSTEDSSAQETDSGTNYILFTLTDTGRGVSNKAIRIYADSYTRKPVNYVKYVLEVIEGNSVVETLYFTMNENIVEATVNRTISDRHSLAFEEVVNQNSNNLLGTFYSNEFESFVEKVSSLTENTNEYEVTNGDILFGYDRYGKPSSEIVIDQDGSTLDSANGTLLSGGSNGSFGDYPIKLKPSVSDDGTTNGLSLYEEEVYKVFNGNFSDDIYDLDNTRIDVIFDAGYNDRIKEAIAELVNFREDCFYFRDYGSTGLTDFLAIEAKKEDLKDTSRFIADYVNNYKTLDPYTKKRIPVSVTYSLAPLFVNHYIDGVSRPFCGIKYGITFDESELVPGTINFSPKRTPRTDKNIDTYDQKQWFDNYRLNYIAYYDSIPTMDTETTSQEANTQLSDIHNVLLVQKIMHEIRRKCPKNRYTFITGQDYENYKKDIETILNGYASLFDSISISYVNDDNYRLNGIFYAVIKVSFRSVIKSEIFKLTAFNRLTGESTVTTTTISSGN